ncbi:MAG: YceI family protein [Chitinophagaceae bacterium]|nr:YceI family protein [Chitinophagaceae bacterium]
MKKTLLAITGFAMILGLSSFIGTGGKKETVNYNVNAEKSRIDWIGSKKGDFHTGFIPLKSGSIAVEAGKITGGKFVIDLANIKVTDAGGGDRLNGHLKSPDFFDVVKFAEASFEIATVNYTSTNTADITGNLSIKGISVPIKFTANIRSADDKGFFAQAFLSIDRTLLGLKYGVGMVSNDVQLAIHIFGTK